MAHRGGFVVYAAPPPILRRQAMAVDALTVHEGSALTNMDYHFLAQKTSRREHRCWLRSRSSCPAPAV